MATGSLPRTPVKNWEKTRDEWIFAVEQLLNEAREWSLAENWLVSLDEKSVSEDQIGTYSVPTLTIRTPACALILDPIARFVVGALGRADFCVFPSFNKVVIARTAKGWQFVTNAKKRTERPWTKAAFLRFASQLSKNS